MSSSKRGSWGNSFTFILAAVGSAVGLGNAWRFPGLASKYGGGTFLLIYFVLMLIMGVPLLMMEISIGRKTRSGVIPALGSLNKKFQWIGWAATTNAFVIVTYYAVVFAWVILMAALSFKFASITGNSEAASSLWATSIQTTGTTSGFLSISTLSLLALLVAWALIYYCIRNGASSVGKVVKYTVFIPIICLIVMAIKGITMPGGIDGLIKLFKPDLSILKTPNIWIDACGQVFYSLSIMMAIMFAYGSYLPEDTNIARDGLIIAFSDLAISVLSGIVMFTTMGGVGMMDKISDSGVATAFIIYPQAIVHLTSNGVVNAIFAFVFYLCLCTLAIDSAFSIVEGVSASISDKYRIDAKKTTILICSISGIISILFTTQAGLACLDIVDYYANSINLVFIGICETVAIGWFFKPKKLLKEINRNTTKFKMNPIWFTVSIKFVSPVILISFFIWNIYSLIAKSNGIYGAGDGYSLTCNIILGWGMSLLVAFSGLIAFIIEKAKKVDKKYIPTNWDDIK